MILKAGDSLKINKKQKESIDAVLDYYGDKTAHWLSMLTHQELPWRCAREGLSDGENCTFIISKESMMSYYDGLS
jgi:uncharacterized phage-associated protein